MKPDSPRSCYSPRSIALALVAAGIIIAAAALGRWFEKGSAPRLALALVQTAATVVVIADSLLALRRLDELQQRIQLTALAIAFGGTGAIVTGYAWLEAAGLPHVDWGLLVWPLMAGLWALGFWLANRRYS